MDQKVAWFRNLIANHPTAPDAVSVTNIEMKLDTTFVPQDNLTLTKLVFDYNDGKSMLVTFEIYDRHERVHSEALDRTALAQGTAMPTSITRHLPDFLR